MNTEKVLLSVSEVVKVTGLGRTNIYTILKSGDLKSVLVGARRLVRATDLAAWVAGLEARSASGEKINA